MKMRLLGSIWALSAMLALAASCSKESEGPSDIPVAENVRAVENELMQTVNEYRLSQGHAALNFSQLAYDYANQHTDYMIASGAINHDGFSARASEITAQVDAKSVAENVAKDYPSAEKAFEGWLGSESHRKTMVGEFTHTAVSVKKSPEGKLFYTQLFYQQ